MLTPAGLRRRPIRAGTPGATASSPRSSASTASPTGTPGRSRCSASGPIWMSGNEAHEAADGTPARGGRDLRLRALREGARRRPLLDRDEARCRRATATYLARGEKYYIGNGNEAAHGLDLRQDRRHRRLRLLRRRFAAREVRVRAERRATASPTLPSTSSTTTRSPRTDILSHGDRRPGTRRSTPSTSASSTWAGRRSASARTPSTRPSTTPSHRKLYGMHVTDFPHVKAALHRCLRAARGDEAGGAAGGRLHALGLARGPALPALQPGREDEGHHPGRGRDQPPVGRDRRQGLREGHATSRWRPATSARCRSSRERCTSTSR